MIQFDGDIITSITRLQSLIAQITTISVFVLAIIKPIRKKLKDMLLKTFSIDEFKNSIAETNKEIIHLKERQEKRDEQIENLMRMFEEHVEESKKQRDIDRECDLFQLRDIINKVYNKYMPLGYIPSIVRENLIKGFEIYKKKGGNSYIEQIVHELLELPVKL